MRPSRLRLLHVVTLVVLSTLACDKQPAAEAAGDAKKASEDPKQADKADPDGDPGDDDKEASFAKPTAEPPPAPEGAVTLRDPWLYVQTCAEPHPCPELMQPAGDAHCRELDLGGFVNWRLPNKDEVPRFEGVDGLENTAGYHWTRTPFGEDASQVWIVDAEDPQNAPATTIPRDRKPFRIRCVQEP